MRNRNQAQILYCMMFNYLPDDVAMGYFWTGLKYLEYISSIRKCTMTQIMAILGTETIGQIYLNGNGILE
jgi:hypothetical protein